MEASAQLAFDRWAQELVWSRPSCSEATPIRRFRGCVLEKALQQGLRTDNLVISGSQEGPSPLEPSSMRQGHKPGGYVFTVSAYRDHAGCLIGKSWRIK